MVGLDVENSRAFRCSVKLLFKHACFKLFGCTWGRSTLFFGTTLYTRQGTVGLVMSNQTTRRRGHGVPVNNLRFTANPNTSTNLAGSGAHERVPSVFSRAVQDAREDSRPERLPGPAAGRLRQECGLRDVQVGGDTRTLSWPLSRPETRPRKLPLRSRCISASLLSFCVPHEQPFRFLLSLACLGGILTSLFFCQGRLFSRLPLRRDRVPPFRDLSACRAGSPLFWDKPALLV